MNPDSDSVVLGPRVELRVGIHVGSFLTLEGIAGGTRRALTHWNDCGSGENCVADFPLATTMDFGAMLQAHTNPRRERGNFDFHLGVGVRPWSTILLDDESMGTIKLTSTVFPGELGASLFFGSAVSLDLLAQGELWVPWKYCDNSSNLCVDSEELHPEFAWSALAGLTFHID